MSIWQAVLLGIIQGLTEFIPVSSSGHLLLAHELLGIAETGLTFDVALHIGTFLALLLFFWRDVWQLLQALFKKSEQTRLAWFLIAATIPAVLAGIALEDMAQSTFRSARLVSFTLIAVAILMIIAERINRRRKGTPLNKISLPQAIIVGIAQAVALVPGVSRSGSTITAGLFAGLDRVAATRFSFLLALPITFGAILKVVSQDEAVQYITNESGIFIAGILAAFVSGFIAIRFLLRFVAKHTLDVFAYYRIALGLIVLLVTLI